MPRSGTPALLDAEHPDAQIMRPIKMTAEKPDRNLVVPLIFENPFSANYVKILSKNKLKWPMIQEKYLWGNVRGQK